MQKKGFGYEPTKPIRVFMVLGEEDYLESLKCKEGDIVEYNRIGSVGNPIGDMPLDLYYVNVVDKNNSNQIKRYFLYFNMYCLEKDTRCPEDFEFKSEDKE